MGAYGAGVPERKKEYNISVFRPTNNTESEDVSKGLRDGRLRDGNK